MATAGVLLFPPPAILAHGDDQMLIDALTEELAKAPEADLFIRRGELYRHHDEWKKAEADFIAAAKLEPKLAIVDYFRAQVLLESGAAAKARMLIDRYIANAPDEAEGWFLRGDVLAALGQHSSGAAAYAEGLRRTKHPRPEHYLRRAKFLAAAPGAKPADVLASVDEGVTRLGPVASLLDCAIKLELELKNHAGALARIAVLMEHAPRREIWLVRQGDILVACGRTKEAAASYRAALSAIEALPPHYRDTVPVEKLAQDARVALSQLSAK